MCVQKHAGFGKLIIQQCKYFYRGVICSISPVQPYQENNITEYIYIYYLVNVTHLLI